MAYEIDYIPVGNGERGGDAIALRFGNLSGPRSEQCVVVIDGGFQESGEKLVQHIKNFYHTDFVNFAISTHPDADHASGLYVVLEQLRVGTLLMHKPWDHAANIKSFFKSKTLTVSGLEEKLEKSLQNASDLEDMAIKKGVSVFEPFQGGTGFNGAFHILGPSLEYYENLLPHFRETPAPKEEDSLLAPLFKAAKEAIRYIGDRLDIDLLNDDEDTTSAENNTSTIILFTIDGKKLLFTGDAGKTALHLAADYASQIGIALTDLAHLDVPHHGSKRNLSSNVLKKIRGEKASISAPPDSPKHPSKKVINALKKFGMRVFVAKDITICHSHEAPARAGWKPVPEEPFYNVVEE